MTYNNPTLIAVFVISILLQCNTIKSDVIQPQQIHLTFGGSVGEYIVSFVTLEPMQSSFVSVVQYGFSANNLSSVATSSPFVFVYNSISRVMHNVALKNLPIDGMIYYRVSVTNPQHYESHQHALALSSSPILQLAADHTWSNVYSFQVFNDAKATMSFAIFGDFGTHPGILNSSLHLLIQDTEQKEHDFVVHVGDIAYNLDTDNGVRGDDFMNDIQNISAYVPYMTSIGCHERGPDNSYEHYLTRYAALDSMRAASQSSSIRYYSWDRQLVHFISIDTDAWIYYDSIPLQHTTAQAQYEWLIRDLQSIDRTKTPWVIVYGHRSMYCTRGDNEWYQYTECSEESASLRNGVFGYMYPLEKLFMQYGVDFYLSGHTHHYERSYPVYNNQTIQTNYDTPQGVVYVVSGMAGIDGIDEFTSVPALWDAYRDMEYTASYSHIIIHNHTHMTFQQRAAYDGHVMDSFVLYQPRHGAFPLPDGDDDGDDGDSWRSRFQIVVAVLGSLVIALIIVTIMLYVKVQRLNANAHYLSLRSVGQYDSTKPSPSSAQRV